MIPHADALVHSAEISRVASSLATAGQTWLRVLQGDIDVTTVRRGVSALEQVGLAWGAQHLAAQAAARTPDRQAMLELMQVARASHRTSTNDQRPTTSGEAESSASHLTEREWEVATMVVDGLNYRGIGERLFISPKTVEHHVARIRRRLGAESRQDMLAALRGLMAADDPGIDGEISQSGR